MSRSKERASESGELARVGAREVHEKLISRGLAGMIGVRRIMGPALLVLALSVAWFDPTSWRRLLLGALSLLLVGLMFVDARLSRRLARGEDLGTREFAPNLLAISCIQHVMFVATGGLVSPLLPVVLPIAFIAGHVSRRWALILLVTVHLPSFWLQAWIGIEGSLDLIPVFLERPLGGGMTVAGYVLVATIMSVAVTLSTVVSGRASVALDLFVDDALRSRDRALEIRTRQNAELSGLSAEIAHELKNPLASIKGLGQLVGRELERSETSPKASERMGVLLREVERMQGILDEFLNFSRPLAPLSQREVELRELVDHVVDLHEAMASEWGVELVASGRARCVCDPRKVEQILINLVQNALEAGGTIGRVELEVRAEAIAKAAHVIVRDDGPGLSDAVAGRAFEIGISDKARGSGLGLTVARAIARQHGGELELGARPDRRAGCVARLSLPTDPNKEPTDEG